MQTRSITTQPTTCTTTGCHGSDAFLGGLDLPIFAAIVGAVGFTVVFRLLEAANNVGDTVTSGWDPLTPVD